MNRELLLSYGIDWEKGLRNCMGSEQFYKKILSMFRRDDCFKNAEAAHAAGDHKKLFSCMHELKGTSGNAALTELYEATIPLVELLRRGTDADGQVDKLFAEVSTAYSRACSGIALIIEEE